MLSGIDVVEQLSIIPSGDHNYKCLLYEATDDEIVRAIIKMKNENGFKKTRINCCKNELKRRGASLCDIDIIITKTENYMREAGMI